MSRLKKILKSTAYARAWKVAEEVVKNPAKLQQLSRQLDKKIARRVPDALQGIKESLYACIRMIKAYASGSYRQIPWQSIVVIVAAMVYFVMPLDVIPDILVGVGFLDDATLLAWAINKISQDINAFLEWESQQEKPAGNQPDE